jgi:hypothetical protein
LFLPSLRLHSYSHDREVVLVSLLEVVNKRPICRSVCGEGLNLATLSILKESPGEVKPLSWGQAQKVRPGLLLGVLRLGDSD